MLIGGRRVFSVCILFLALVWCMISLLVNIYLPTIHNFLLKVNMSFLIASFPQKLQKIILRMIIILRPDWSFYEMYCSGDGNEVLFYSSHFFKIYFICFLSTTVPYAVVTHYLQLKSLAVCFRLKTSAPVTGVWRGDIQRKEMLVCIKVSVSCKSIMWA